MNCPQKLRVIKLRTCMAVDFSSNVMSSYSHELVQVRARRKEKTEKSKMSYTVYVSNQPRFFSLFLKSGFFIYFFNPLYGSSRHKLFRKRVSGMALRPAAFREKIITYVPTTEKQRNALFYFCGLNHPAFHLNPSLLFF